MYFIPEVHCSEVVKLWHSQQVTAEEPLWSCSKLVHQKKIHQQNRKADAWDKATDGLDHMDLITWFHLCQPKSGGSISGWTGCNGLLTDILYVGVAQN